LKLVGNVDVSNEMVLSFTVVIDVVNNSFVYLIEGSMEFNDTLDIDVTIVELDSIKIAVLVALKVGVVVPLFDIADDKGKEEYSVEVVKVLNKGSDDVEPVIKIVCV
jgi:pyruvate/2-oxoglutarate dehydrogenase complex dihydrolipoamide acyltransferase (E2) component